MSVVTLQGLKMIGRLEEGKLGLNVFMRQMKPHVKWHFFGQKVIFSVSDVVVVVFVW